MPNNNDSSRPDAAPAKIPPVVLISGISGSGKSVALNALEDAGYFCVDNLPPELLHEFIRLERKFPTRRLAIAADVRTASSLPKLLPVIDALRREGTPVLPIFLDSRTETLVRRFSETRRRHPLSAEDDDHGHSRSALGEAIERERDMLSLLREISTVIDTSDLRPTQLRSWVRQLVGAAHSSLTLVFESFAFKHGVPRDADLVFDLRVLPNPHYVRELRALNGRDAGVIDFLRAQPEVAEMLAQIEGFLARWLPAYEQDQRSYLTVAIGCTGGQHRSVYSAEQLAARFRERIPTLIRHREIEAREAAAAHP
ncbi:MAG: RNase adapter RapZ [Pseudomonadota bacterium]|uniref:RNase adapter RapZ n=1 Tax=Sphaerotilus sp. TaxID=2093942 RepID=UPI00286E7AE9|nr:RNase adapter RapZ [Sphaerotilus sp.]